VCNITGRASRAFLVVKKNAALELRGVDVRNSGDAVGPASIYGAVVKVAWGSLKVGLGAVKSQIQFTRSLKKAPGLEPLHAIAECQSSMNEEFKNEVDNQPFKPLLFTNGSTCVPLRRGDEV
jgi:hypothetical protein